MRRITWLRLISFSSWLPFLVVISACQPLPDQFETSYHKARFYAPERYVNKSVCVQTRLDLFDVYGCQIIATDKLPVFIWAHGCAGYNHTDIATSEFLTDLGYIVVSPNSLANGRSKSCGTGNTSRSGEIRYALDVLVTKPWVDKDRIFVGGHSEGGLGVAEYDGSGTRASIILGYACSHGLNNRSPILNINGKRDNWLRRDRLCSGVEKALLVDAGHHPLADLTTLREIEAFLYEHDPELRRN